MGSFKEFCPDADKVKSGVRLPLFNADGGISKDYIMVRWAWDDSVRAAMDALRRNAEKQIVQIKPGMDAKAKKEAEAKNEQTMSALVLEGIVSQVAGWSFEEKPTKANVLEFLKARPDLAERIDTASANNKLFFTKSGASS